MRPLTSNEHEAMNWETLPNFNMVRIRTDADGSCFFHAILKAYFKPYIDEEISGKTFDRRKFVRNLRKDLAVKLGQPVRKNSKKTYYSLLNKGEMSKIAEEMPEYSLERLQAELDSSSPIGNIYNEFISNELGIDIYILDGIKRDVYMTGSDDQLLYKNRKSVVILYLPGHYELVGLLRRKGEYVETVFNPDSPFIEQIKTRMNELRSDSL